MLRDFDLRREDSADTGRSPTVQVVRATLKPGRRHPSIRSALIELDAESKVIRRLVLERTRRAN